MSLIAVNTSDQTIPAILERQNFTRELAGQRPKNTKEKVAAPVRAPQAARVWYERSLRLMIRRMLRFTALHMKTLSLDAEPVGPPPPGTEQALAAGLAAIEVEMIRLQRFSEQIAAEFVGRVNLVNSEKFYASVESAIGINLEAAVVEEGLAEVLGISVQQNVALIKSIPAEYFQKLEQIVLSNAVQGRATSAGIRAEIRELGGVTLNRAEFISRDQTAKLNANLNETRNLNLGITEYIWRNAPRDGRNRQKHLAHEGKRFRFDRPPVTGNKGERLNPGEDYQCRCVAIPIVPGTGS